jgi:hypothetical protein
MTSYKLDGSCLVQLVSFKIADKRGSPRKLEKAKLDSLTPNHACQVLAVTT